MILDVSAGVYRKGGGNSLCKIRLFCGRGSSQTTYKWVQKKIVSAKFDCFVEVEAVKSEADSGQNIR